MTNSKENQAIELRKPKKTITITTQELSINQIKAFNYILREFYYKAKTEEGGILSTYLLFTHSEIQDAIGASKTNNKHLFDDLDKLSDVKVKYLRGNDWGNFHLISSAVKIDDMIEIALPPPLLRELFAKDYTILDLVKIKAMSSKYTILMYEWCEKYRKENIPIFPIWSIDELKELFGIVGKSTYNRFQEIQSRILKPSIKELEQVTGIKMTYELKKKGTKYDTIRFSATYPHKKPTQEQKAGKIAFERGKAIYSASSKENRIEWLKKEILKLTKENEVDKFDSKAFVIENYKKELATLEPVQEQKLI